MEEVLKILKEKNINFELVEHEEVHTMEDMEKLGLFEKGIVCKNLFLRNSNGKMNFVVSCMNEKEINMAELSKKIGSTKLSFGSSERLEKFLKLKNGYVSPFGVINDDSTTVIFVFDKDLKDKPKVGFHPNTNTATIFLAFNDVKKLIENHGNDVVFVKL